MPEEEGSGRLRLRVMTFNIRFDTELDAPDHTWGRRRKAVVKLIRRHGPDVVGVQEALAHQLGDLLEALPDYRHVGRAREAGGRGEFVPILFDRRRLEVIQSGDFWLSQTPDTEGSLGWDAPNPRICTWVVLRDLIGDRSILVLNTHLDRSGERARAESATMLVEKMAEFSTLPCIVTADLNSGEGDRPFSILEAAMLRDSYRDLFDGRAAGTVHHYTEPAGAKIDFVLCDPSWRVLSAAVIHDRPFQQWPSDHFPVMADLELIGHSAMVHQPSYSRTEPREEAEMPVKPIPDGYHSVTPYLIVQGADKLVDFLKRAFSAEETVRMPRPDGSVSHAEVRIGDSVVMLADAGEQWSPMPSMIHLYVDDCEATYLRALESGATSLQEPEDQFYGDRSAGVRDPVGNHWWISTHVEDVSEEEIARRAQEGAGQQQS